MPALWCRGRVVPGRRRRPRSTSVQSRKTSSSNPPGELAQASDRCVAFEASLMTPQLFAFVVVDDRQRDLAVELEMVAEVVEVAGVIDVGEGDFLAIEEVDHLRRLRVRDHVVERDADDGDLRAERGVDRAQ